MSPEAALLQETWTLVRTHINTRDRAEVAEQMLQLFDDLVGLGDLEVYANEFDRPMKAAIVAHYGEDEDGDDLDLEW